MQGMRTLKLFDECGKKHALLAKVTSDPNMSFKYDLQTTKNGMQDCM